MRSAKRTAPTPEQIEAERQRLAEEKAEREARWLSFKRRASAIILEQPFQLLGQDVPSWGHCAEEMAFDGAKKRFEAVGALAFFGASDDALRRLVHADPRYLSDRMHAIWWRCLNVHRLYDFKDPAKTDAKIEAAYQPVPDLVEAGILHYDAQTLLCGTEDVFLHAREQARREHAEFQARLVALRDVTAPASSALPRSSERATAPHKGTQEA